MRLLVAALLASAPTVATTSAPLSKACNESFARDCPGLLGGGTKCLICLHSHGADMMAHGCPNVSWPQPVFRVFCEGAAPPLRHAITTCWGCPAEAAEWDARAVQVRPDVEAGGGHHRYVGL